MTLSTGQRLFELTSARDQYSDAREQIAQWRASAGNEVTAVMGNEPGETRAIARSALSVLDDIAVSRYQHAEYVFKQRVDAVYRRESESA